MSYSKKDLVNFRIHKAKATFQDALLLVDAGRWDSAANRLYYAGYYMISAYLAEREIKTTTHTGVKTNPDAFTQRNTKQKNHLNLPEIVYLAIKIKQKV